ncbi:2-oxoadipate dioxygenase/decarboxylase family protein [Ottowia pentelensis]|uniref:2-oxoadipate dioxygenase/decarboxylase n=1 Tax=Ottowia pentelensis TaxID=511108 RepID=A0ABV6PWP8_9BURK|nr:VOC family protein [Ottowia sp.]
MPADDIRALFSRAMSDMYRSEVPQYGLLCELVARVNAQAMERDPALAARLQGERQLERLDVERHGAIRVGTAQELATLRRLFAVMGMQPVGYYDLSPAGIPVHSTAFRPVDEAALARNPFRVFTSLLRLELLADAGLRDEAARILAKRRIFTPRCLALIEQAEQAGGLDEAQAREFVAQALETFRWHSEATVDLPTYQRLRGAHALVADIVCFKGPHINHLTPRTLDIDAAQQAMRQAGLAAKEVVEGPPRRDVPILLRQTSFLALEESIRFTGGPGAGGTHTARFGEIEQRGCALTRKGRALYDTLLAEAQARAATGSPLAEAMAEGFRRFPDDAATLQREGLAFFRYAVDADRLRRAPPPPGADLAALVAGGWLQPQPITYEDFLPVSAAGIFRSNLGAEVRERFDQQGNQVAFESALGTAVIDEIALYETAQAASLAACMRVLHQGAAALSA